VGVVQTCMQMSVSLKGRGLGEVTILLKHCQMFYVKTFKTINVTDTDELFTITCI